MRVLFLTSSRLDKDARPPYRRVPVSLYTVSHGVGKPAVGHQLKITHLGTVGGASVSIRLDSRPSPLLSTR